MRHIINIFKFSFFDILDSLINFIFDLLINILSSFLIHNYFFIFIQLFLYFHFMPRFNSIILFFCLDGIWVWIQSGFFVWHQQIFIYLHIGRFSNRTHHPFVLVDLDDVGIGLHFSQIVFHERIFLLLERGFVRLTCMGAIVYIPWIFGFLIL